MPNKELKYCEYFNVNEKYFPCIDESAINSGVSWQATYPHEAFISLLNGAEKMLGGITNKSLWIHGAYGTGKSQCAYALKKILEAPEAEVRAELEKEYEVKTYKVEKMAEYKDDILVPELVMGTTKEEIDASIQSALERSKQIRESLGISDGTKPKKKTTPKTPANPSSSSVQDKDISLERLATMDVRSPEYAELRKQLGLH